MKGLLIFICTFALYSAAYSQPQNGNIITEVKKIKYGDGLRICNVCKVNPPVTYIEDLEYSWYNDYSKVQQTIGGTGGNLLHGLSQFFGNDGKLIQESNYYLGLRDGFSKEWNKGGEISQIVKFDKGRIIYFKEKSADGNSISEWIGTPEEVGSVERIFDVPGFLVQTKEVVDIFKYKVTDYYPLGKMVKRIYTIESLLSKAYGKMFFDGEYLSYYENGNLKLSGRYIENRRDGDWKWYNEDGSLDYTEKYRITQEYSSDNKIIAEGGEFFNENKKEWVRHGLWVWFKGNGQWGNTINYEYGVEVGKY